jgi:hypothetical protein
MSGPGLGREAPGVFEVPKEVNDVLEEISTRVGLVTAWEDHKARRGPNDLSGVLVSHVIELYGALHLLGLALGSKCPRQVTRLLEDFRDTIEDIAHYLWHGEPENQKDVILNVDGLLFRMEVAMYTLAIACVHAGPEDLAELNAEPKAVADN